MWTVVLLTTIRKARNNCQDVDHCWDEDHCLNHIRIDHYRTGNRCQDSYVIGLYIHVYVC